MHGKESYWEAQAPLWDKIRAAGGMTPYVASLDGVVSAFEPRDRSVRCIDERVAGGINIAGSGILLEENVLIDRLRRSGADGIYSHAECGAAKLYAAKKGLDPARADEYGREFAERMAAELGIPYRGHLEVAPSGLHVARAAYYDGTGSFDPTAHPELPPGFVVSRRYHDLSYAHDEMKVAIGIALGEHGFGGLFSTVSPFHLVAIGGTRAETETLADELAPLAMGNPLLHVDSFVAPL